MRMAQKRFCRRVALVTSNQANQGTPYLSLIILILPRISLRKESKNRYGVPGFRCPRIPDSIVPQAVYHEIAVPSAGEPGAQEMQRLSWIITHTVADQRLVHSLCVELGRGEAKAIACASELNTELLLVDEERGRAITQRLGLRVIGLLGVLIEAQHRGLIDTVNSILDALVNRAGFWVTRDFICTSVTGGWGKSLCYELTAHR
jgi:uncharacterized protein